MADALVDRVAVALTDAQTRYDAAVAAHQALQQEAREVTARGVALERTILGLAGELAALQRLTHGG